MQLKNNVNKLSIVVNIKVIKKIHKTDLMVNSVEKNQYLCNERITI